MNEDPKIIGFPTEAVRSWRAMEAAVREAMAAAGDPSPECIDYVVDRLKTSFPKLNASFTIAGPPECEACVQDVARQFREVVHIHLMELMFGYIEIWGLRTALGEFGGPRPVA